MPEDVAPASRKLGREDAARIAAEVNTIVVAKGKKLSEFKISGKPADEALDAMLGPTGNLRAPTLRAGSTLLIGFNEDSYRAVLLG